MNRNRIYILTFLYLALSQITILAQSQNIYAEIKEIIEKSELNNSSIGLSIVELKTGKKIVDINSNKLLTPASTAKLLTTFTAYDLLGPQATFKTSIGYSGEIKESGILEGDIIIIGGGDPTLGSSRNNPNGRYDRWITQIETLLKDHHITCVDGDIIMDISCMTDANIPPKWPWEDLGNYYGAGSWPININENILRITFAGNNRNHQDTKILRTEPLLDYVNYVNHVKTSTPQGRDEAYIYGGPYQYQRQIRGTIPTVSKEFTIKGSLPNPPFDLGTMINSQLPKLFPNAEIKISNTPIINFTLLNEYHSLPLIQLITEANYKSINIYCDAILRLLGQSNNGNGSIKNGLSIIENHLEQLGLPNTELALKDGSGLSPSNLVTTSLMAEFIRKSIIKNPDVMNSLPQVGKDGTVRSLLKNKKAASMYRLKSGSMDRVVAYGGVIMKDGKQYSISLIVNNYTHEYKIIKKNIEKILETTILHL